MEIGKKTMFIPLDKWDVKKKRKLLSGLISISFIVITVFFGLLNGVNGFCFLFHLIPFGVGFVGGSILIIIIYYILLFLLIGGVVYGFINLLKQG